MAKFIEINTIVKYNVCPKKYQYTEINKRYRNIFNSKAIINIDLIQSIDEHEFSCDDDYDDIKIITYRIHYGDVYYDVSVDEFKRIKDIITNNCMSV